MSRTRFHGRSAALTAATAALALLVTGCGGTRVSDEAIQAAAGVGTNAANPAGVPAGTGVSGAPGTDSAGGDPGAPAVAPGTAGEAPGTDPSASKGVGGAGDPASAGGKPAPGKNPSGGAAGEAPAASGGVPVAPAAPAVANKSVIKLGAVGTFSGPVGSLVKDTVTGIRVWAQHVNSTGGVNGHPVEILVGDDGGDPARYISTQRQFVEEKGVIAFLYGTLGVSPNGNNQYLDSTKIFAFGPEGGLETAYNNPFVLSPNPTGLVNADSILYALADVAVPQGKTKFAEFACSDFGLCDNFDQRWSNPAGLKKVGFELVARGRPSLTQPDYTSQCLAAKQAGAQVVMLALDTASLRRFAGDCARQNYKPIYGTADTLALPSLAEDPNADGLIVAAKQAPWTDLSVPGTAQAVRAFAKFAPGTQFTGGNNNGWILGEFFAAAGKSLPDNPTPADITEGIYKIKNNNLNGLTYPITMTAGQPMKKQLCYGVVVVKGGKYDRYPGPGLRCKPLLPTGDASVNSALPASAPAVTPLPGDPAPSAPLSMPIAGSSEVLTWRVSSLRPGSANACPPARVAGISYFLDAFQTGSSAGPGVFYGIALAVIGTPLPEPFAQFQAEGLAQSAIFVERISDEGPAAFQSSREFFAPGAAFNEGGNTFIDAASAGLETVASTFGPFIQPGDRSLRELAAAMQDAKATNTPC
ncbi:MAG: ABC transporter substrate-binding protein [Sporichthyaceae bacterium]